MCMRGSCQYYLLAWPITKLWALLRAARKGTTHARSACKGTSLSTLTGQNGLRARAESIHLSLVRPQKKDVIIKTTEPFPDPLVIS